MVVIERKTTPQDISIYSAITSATTFHLLVKCVLLIFVIWVAFVWGPPANTNHELPTINILNPLIFNEKKYVVSIISIITILIVWFLKRQHYYTDDLFFIAIILVIWVYAWRQNTTISQFLSKIERNSITDASDGVLPPPGTNILDLQGLKASPVSKDSRTGNLPEHYDYIPDGITKSKRTNKLINRQQPIPYDPSTPITSSKLPEFNRMIKLLEPSDHPVYKLTNEVLTALEDTCLSHDSTDAAKPMTEFMRQNGAGQSKWAFIEESVQEGQDPSLTNIITKSLDNKSALQEMFTAPNNSPDNKFDSHEYAYQTDSANKKYPGVDNHCSLLGYCTNINLPNKHSLNIISSNIIHKHQTTS